MASDRDALAARLHSYHAVAFGVESCPHTAEMRRAWGKALGPPSSSPRIVYIGCDASPKEEELCRSAGIQTTPTLAFGGVQFPGYVPLPRVRELLDLADAVGDGLVRRDAVCYVRPGCVWSLRQRTTLGPIASKVAFVDCSVESARCAAAGVQAVPAWQVGGAAAPVVHGFQPIPGLQALVNADESELRSQAATSSAALRGAARGGASERL